MKKEMDVLNNFENLHPATSYEESMELKPTKTIYGMGRPLPSGFIKYKRMDVFPLKISMRLKIYRLDAWIYIITDLEKSLVYHFLLFLPD